MAYLETRTATELHDRCDVAACTYPCAVVALSDTGFPFRWYCAAHANRLCPAEHPRLSHGDRCVGCGGLG